MWKTFGLFSLSLTLAVLTGCSSTSGGSAAPPTGSAGATLSVTSLAFPNTTVSASAAALSLTLTSSGTAALTISSVTLGGTNPADFALSANSCSGTLAVGATCTVAVTFMPAAATAYSASLTFTDSVGSQAVALSGAGSTPGASLSVSSLVFPNTNLGVTAAAMSTTLTNNGVSTLSISGIALAGANPGDFAISANTCGNTLAVGTSCVVSVTFTPLTAGALTATLNFTDTAAASPQMVQLQGTGTTPLVTLSPTNLAFGNAVVGSIGNTLTVSFTASGTGTVNLNGLTFTGANPTNFSATSNCVSPIPAGTTCAISVTFVPTTVGASYSATMSVADNAANSPQLVTMSGAGISVPIQNTCSATLHATGPAQPAPTANYAATAFSGAVMAGSLPVVGASVQVYAAGTTGNGSTPTPMLTTPLITDGNGKFSVAATFTCPYSNSVLYAVATGGQASSGGVLNAGIELMSVLGVCNTLTNNATYTINEATTVASVYAMAQFMKTGAQIGATSTNALGLGLAAATAANLVNVSTGAQPGAYFPSTGVAPTAKIDTLANALNACVVSSAMSSQCTALYADTGGTNTLDAALSIAQNPAQNPSGLYVLGTASTAYSPVLTAAPADWTMLVTYTGANMNDPTAVSIDSTGKVWVGNYFDVASYFSNTGVPLLGYANPSLQEVYGGTVDYNDHIWFADEETNDAYNGDANGGKGAVAVLNTSGTLLAGYLNGGIYFPIAVAMDLSGNGWIADYGNAGVVVLTNAGVPVSGASGYNSSQFEFPAAVATDSKCNAYVANQSSDTVTKVIGDGSSFTSFAVGAGPSGVAVDESDNVWSANFYASTVGLVSAGGSVVSGTAGYSGGGINHPQGIAVDSKGKAWIANFRGPALTELAAAGTKSAGQILSPASGWAPDSGIIEAFGLAIDPSGNIWVTDFGQNALTEYVGLAAPVKTPLLGPVQVP
jgi:hypothetical protein